MLLAFSFLAANICPMNLREFLAKQCFASPTDLPVYPRLGQRRSQTAPYPETTTIETVLQLLLVQLSVQNLIHGKLTLATPVQPNPTEQRTI